MGNICCLYSFSNIYWILGIRYWVGFREVSGNKTGSLLCQIGGYSQGMRQCASHCDSSKALSGLTCCPRPAVEHGQQHRFFSSSKGIFSACQWFPHDPHCRVLWTLSPLSGCIWVSVTLSVCPLACLAAQATWQREVQRARRVWGLLLPLPLRPSRP